MKKQNISNTNIKKIADVDDVSTLKQEISTLRDQIDSLKDTSLNMRKQNFILSERLEELKKSNAALEELQKEKNEMFALIVHDIKNPTAIIKNLVELLRSYDLHDDERSVIIDDLVSSTKQIIALSQEVSKVLTLDNSQPTFFYEWAEPGRILTEIIKMNSINAAAKKQTIHVDLKKDLPQFKVDVNRICEVFDNIISNAIKYTPLDGKIGIYCDQQDDNIVTKISDTGLGMSEEDLQKAFQRGMKLSAKPTGGETSSGLGLWIVKKIVEAHKGKVWINSKLGVGTTFSISIPIDNGEGEDYE